MDTQDTLAESSMRSTMHLRGRMDQQQQATQNVEAVKLLSDFAKWLVTIETTAIAAIGYVLTFRNPYQHLFTSVLACFAVGFFAASILFATLLLRSLPGIMQNIRPGHDIWSTKDKGSMAGGLTTSRLVELESVCFAIGLLLLAVVVGVKVLSKP